MSPPRNLEIARRLAIEEPVRAELAKLTPRERRRLRLQMTARREVVQAPAYTTSIGVVAAPATTTRRRQWRHAIPARAIEQRRDRMGADRPTPFSKSLPARGIMERFNRSKTVR